MKKHLRILLCLVLFGLLAKAQPRNIGFDRYSLGDGLSHSTVFCIAQDAKGYIWMGTKEGLNRFDGYGFSAYQYDLKDSKSISGTSVYSMLIDSKNRFWLGTNEGVNWFDNETFEAIHIPYNRKDSTGTNSGVIWDIKEDSKGNIWLATDDGLALWSAAKKHFVHTLPPPLRTGTIHRLFIDEDDAIWIATRKRGVFIYNPNSGELKGYDTSSGLLQNEVRGVFVDRNKQAWISSNKGITRLDVRHKTIKHYVAGSLDFPDGNGSNAILVDSKGMIWAGSWGAGLSWYNALHDNFVSVQHDLRSSNSLIDNFVNNVFEDKDGGIWVATSGGACRYDKNRKHFVTYRKELGVRESLSSSTINNVLRDRAGRLWVATKKGGISRWNDSIQGFIHYKKQRRNPSSILTNRVNRLSEDTLGNIWAATSKGVAVLNPATGVFKNFVGGKSVGLSAAYVQTVLCDSLGNVWVGTVGGLDRYIGNKAPFFEPVRLLAKKKNEQDNFLINNIIEDKDHTLWIGTFGKGLLHYNPKTGSVKAYQHKHNQPQSISHNHVHYIYLDGKYVWVGTNGSGLDRLDTETGFFEHITTDDGLPNNVINGILDDGFQNLWVSTNKGICSIDKASKRIKTYDASYGLQSNLFRRRACWRDPDGRLYFGGLSGLTAFYPEDVQDNPVAPVVQIEKMELAMDMEEEGKRVRLDLRNKQEISLHHYQNNFTIFYVGLTYSLAKRNVYQHRLVGFDRHWSSTDEQRRASYTNLPPGTYHFKVKAANSDGRWSTNDASVTIVIVPPWWRRWWAILFEVAVALLLLRLVVLWRTSYYRKQKAILEETVRSRTAALVESREELRSQRDELEQQTVVLGKQSRQIKDSINYAERIQRAMLQSGAQISDQLPKNFIMFKPRDVLSGDFYWAGKIGNRFTLVAADCTGHGVPGAFLSILGITYLNEIAASGKSLSAGLVLDTMREKIKSVFKGTTSRLVSDGMDMALCMFNADKTELDYAGAYNPLFLIRNGELTKIKADSMPIGYYAKNHKSFTTHNVTLQKGDAIYIFTDGYVDQFGGAKGHKYMMKNFRKFLLSIVDKPMEEQKALLEANLTDYQGAQSQVDDVLIIGFTVD